MARYHKSHHVNEAIRYILYGFNFLLWILSVCLLLIGILGVVIREDKMNINNHIDFLTDPAAVLIAIAAVVFAITFFGCIGSLNENSLFLKIYFILLIILFVIEIICGILAFAFSTELYSQVDDVIQQGIEQYREDADLTNFIDFAQRELECCGGKNGYKDWSQNRYFFCNDTQKTINVEACAVPYSCCLSSDEAIINTQCGFRVQELLPVEASNIIYVNGCIDKFVQEIRTRQWLIGLAVFGIAALQLFGIFLAFELCRELEQEKLNYHRHSATPS